MRRPSRRPSIRYPPAARQLYQQELQGYVRSVILQDWPEHPRGLVPQESSKRLRAFKNDFLAFVPPNARLHIVHQQAINQVNELLLAHRLRLRGDQANLPDLLWRVLILGAAINVAISWFFVAKDTTHQVALTCLTALLLSSWRLWIAPSGAILASMRAPSSPSSTRW